MKQLILILSVVVCAVAAASAQQVLRVTTDSLVLRDRPEKAYNVFAILSSSCLLNIDSSDAWYRKNKLVHARFFEVTACVYQGGRFVLSHGWVDKRYVAHFNETLTRSATALRNKGLVRLTTHETDGELNYRLFPPPRFKGAELPAPPVKRKYFNGPRGGCYYLNPKGRKVYVDKKFCK